MFDDVLRMAGLEIYNFRDAVRDSFGASIIAGELDPILDEIDTLRISYEGFRQQVFHIDRLLEETRSIQCRDCGGGQ